MSDGKIAAIVVGVFVACFVLFVGMMYCKFGRKIFVL
jgi:hypothetical protein